MANCLTHIILYTSLLISNYSIAQKINKPNYVSFGCGKGIVISSSVNAANTILENKNYQELENWLNSNSSAKQYLAVVLLEHVQNRNRYILSDSTLTDRMKEIYASKLFVKYCNGCKESGKVRLGYALDYNSKLRKLTKHWLDEWFEGN